MNERELYERLAGLGDTPEDLYWFWREGFPELMRQTMGKSVKADWLGTELGAKDSIGAMLLRLAENYMMPAQHIVPVFAQPLKITTPPGGIELPPPDGGPVPPLTFYTGVSFRVPDNACAIITDVHHELESPAAYNDVNIRLWYRAAHPEFFRPQKPEASSTRITLYQQETFEIQWENNGIISHWLQAEILGYWFSVPQPDKSHRGLRTHTQSQG